MHAREKRSGAHCANRWVILSSECGCLARHYDADWSLDRRLNAIDTLAGQLLRAWTVADAIVRLNKAINKSVRGSAELGLRRLRAADELAVPPLRSVPPIPTGARVDHRAPVRFLRLSASRVATASARQLRRRRPPGTRRSTR